MSEPLVIGLDAGGTQTKLLAVGPSTRERRFGPGVNFQRDGATHTANVLAHLLRETFAELAGTEPTSICLGVAGAGRFEDQQRLAAELRERLAPEIRVPLSVQHDAAIALEGAFGGESGAIVIVGTGSVAYGRTTEGELLRAGGWGYLLGDEGGGYALGLAALKAAAAAMDGGPPSIISYLLAERHGILTPIDLIQKTYQERWAVQELAPLVIEAAEQHDWTATSILKQQANVLAKQVGWLASRAGETMEKRVALLGGLTKPGYYRECIAEALLRHLPRWRIVRAHAEPVEGAVRMAQRLATAQEGVPDTPSRENV